MQYELLWNYSLIFGKNCVIFTNKRLQRFDKIRVKNRFYVPSKIKTLLNVNKWDPFNVLRTWSILFSNCYEIKNWRILHSLITIFVLRSVSQYSITVGVVKNIVCKISRYRLFSLFFFFVSGNTKWLRLFGLSVWVKITTTLTLRPNFLLIFKYQRMHFIEMTMSGQRLVKSD